MHDYCIGDAKSIDQFVKEKLDILNAADRNFGNLFEFMFSQRENVMYERSRGYRIERTTYGEAYDRALVYAEALSEKLAGCEPDSVVGLCMENRIEWLELFWAILAAGFRPLLMNTRMADSTLEQILSSLDAGAVITTERTFTSCKCILLDELSAENKKTDPVFGTEILFMSSGTTDNVKICAYTAEELFWQINDSRAIVCDCKLMKQHYNDRLKQLTFLPFYHVFGFIAVYLWFGFYGRTFVHLEDMSPQTLLNTIRRHEVTHIFAVPLFWETVYRQAMQTISERGEATRNKFLKGMDIVRKLSKAPFLRKLFSRVAFKEIRQNLFGDSISFMITGGSEIHEEVLEFFNSIGYRLADGYGMTEIGITSVELGDSFARLNSCSVGRPFTSVSYKINEQGELLVKSKSAAKYILTGGERQERREWFNTHDLAELKDGCYRILGREDDLVVAANGENLNPNIIESLIDLDTCLVKCGDSPVLLVSLPGYVTKDSFAAASAALAEQLKALKLTGQIGTPVFVSEPFIQGDDFKKNRLKIARDYQNGRFTVISLSDFDREDSQNADSEIKNRVRRLFATAVQKDESAIGDRVDFFLEAGGSSLDYFVLISQIKEAFGVSIPTEMSSELSTVEKIGNYLEEHLKHVD